MKAPQHASLTRMGFGRLAARMAVVTNVPSATNDLRPITPPIAIPPGWAWLAWVAVGLAIAALAYYLWHLWRQRKMAILHQPPVPPHEKAQRRLAEALRLIHDPKPFCTLVSDTLRIYLEERFDFHAPERTTEEFLLELHNTDRLSAEQKELLGEFLRQCDLVKFARYEPAQTELRALHASAVRLVQETEPPAPRPDLGDSTPPARTP